MNNNETYEYYFNTYGLGLRKISEHKTVYVTPDHRVLFYKTDSNFVHRIDGPAVIFKRSDNSTALIKYWWINDHNITLLIHQWAKDNNIDLDNLSEVDKALIKITWGSYGSS